ncbi:hypothetical protein ONS95_002154 [Cadophora gregata]|uniref:uncharacterized protein n=1 Tax=Cadophora gregata TaxID=51156 RepID=UPI0026DD67B1|nr:uncharacterized protein ONS95_002154 [Cadophora gregata]KAK0109461.1 hypothetical protein ONS95_002154 [Cadophora gregata]
MILRKSFMRLSHPFCSPARQITSRRTASSSASATSFPTPRILPSNVLVEEEKVPGYQPDFYYPAIPGQVLKSRYKILSKLGWGTGSTVWLAEDPQSMPSQYVALKINTSNPEYKDAILHELEINQRLIKASSHPGFAFVRAAIDYFMTTGPSGKDHLCLVFEPLREPLNQFQHRLAGDRIPPQLLKVYVDFLLQGLDCLHSDFKLIHTDLKATNILLSFEDLSVIEEYAAAQADHPMPRKKVGDRSIFLSHNDFGTLKSYWMIPKIVDFGLAHKGDGKEPLRHPIQPALYHAPEVLLGAPWSYSADIWNLGVLLFELLEDKELFTNLKSQNNTYTARAHLAEMIALFGPPPQKMIDLESVWTDVSWERSFPNADGKWCDKASAYYGGPFFDLHGSFTHPDLVQLSVKLEDCVTCMEGEEKALFISFVRRMLKWLPEERATAKELQDDPWLQSGL